MCIIQKYLAVRFYVQKRSCPNLFPFKFDRALFGVIQYIWQIKIKIYCNKHYKRKGFLNEQLLFNNVASIAFRMFLKCISLIKESKNVLLFGGERLTLYVDKNIKCGQCGCETNHQCDNKHSTIWTSDPEMKLIKQKINKIPKTKCTYGMLDRRNDPKFLSCEDIEDVIKLQQDFF